MHSIKEIYNSKLANRYDFSMPPVFKWWKKKAFIDLALQAGDKVVVFCCGTGLDFPYILEHIGEEGQIVGIDFSQEMLDLAQRKVDDHQWKNVTLIHADVTQPLSMGNMFDAGVCTLGMSIIPEYEKAYTNLLSLVKPSGKILVGDMQLASGWKSVFNPLTVFMAKKFGGTHEGHENIVKLQKLMQSSLKNTLTKKYFFDSYAYTKGMV
ncbi:MAG: class I SAM-dependent methyltransferase [Thiovulaceae bacterium]|nr:class I SAM-dependent methyltransferase [Sulfurimonadaceae bacterium]